MKETVFLHAGTMGPDLWCPQMRAEAAPTAAFQRGNRKWEDCTTERKDKCFKEALK